MTNNHYPAPLSPQALERLMNTPGHLLLDVRDKVAFSKGFIPGAYFIGRDGDFRYWASYVLPTTGVKILLVAPAHQLSDTAGMLREAGHGQVAGYLEGGFEAWAAVGKPVDTIPTLDVQGFSKAYSQGEIRHILDVRRPDEYKTRHIKGAALLPLEQLRAHLQDEVPQQPRHLHCRSGYRSTIAASMLKAKGGAPVVNLHGMIDEVFEAGVPAEKPA